MAGEGRPLFQDLFISFISDLFNLFGYHGSEKRAFLGFSESTIYTASTGERRTCLLSATTASTSRRTAPVSSVLAAAASGEKGRGSVLVGNSHSHLRAQGHLTISFNHPVTSLFLAKEKIFEHEFTGKFKLRLLGLQCNATFALVHAFASCKITGRRVCSFRSNPRACLQM